MVMYSYIIFVDIVEVLVLTTIPNYAHNTKSGYVLLIILMSMYVYNTLFGAVDNEAHYYVVCLILILLKLLTKSQSPTRTLHVRSAKS